MKVDNPCAFINICFKSIPQRTHLSRLQFYNQISSPSQLVMQHSHVNYKAWLPGNCSVLYSDLIHKSNNTHIPTTLQVLHCTQTETVRIQSNWQFIRNALIKFMAIIVFRSLLSLYNHWGWFVFQYPASSLLERNMGFMGCMYLAAGSDTAVMPGSLLRSCCRRYALITSSSLQPAKWPPNLSLFAL